MRQPKIVIVGAGLVGGSAALLTALAVPSAEVVIIDVARVRAEGQMLDLTHAAAFWGHNHFYAGDYQSARDADIVVITAGVGVRPGETRLHLARANADIANEIVDRIAPLAPDAIYVIATNPCDVLAGVVFDRLRCARERVISTGTALDTGRLLLTRSGKTLGPASRDLILRSVHDAANLIKEGKGATHYGIGSAIGRICEAIVHNIDLILTVAIVHAEVEGIPDVCVSLPMVANGSGARLLAYPELDPADREALQRSARVVKDAVDGVLPAR